MARTTYLQAVTAAVFNDQVTRGDTGQLAQALAAAPRPVGTPSPADLLLEAIAAHNTQGYAAGAAILRAAMDQFATETSPDNELRGRWLCSLLACWHLWDYQRWQLHSESYLELVRASGALSELPMALTSEVYRLAYFGDLSASAAVNQELQAVMEATAGSFAPYAALYVAAMRGRPGEVTDLIDAARSDLIQRGESFGITTASFTSALANNGVGNYEAALRSASEWELFEVLTSTSSEPAAPTGDRRSSSLLDRL